MTHFLDRNDIPRSTVIGARRITRRNREASASSESLAKGMANRAALGLLKGHQPGNPIAAPQALAEGSLLVRNMRQRLLAKGIQPNGTLAGASEEAPAPLQTDSTLVAAMKRRLAKQEGRA